MKSKTSRLLFTLLIPLYGIAQESVKSPSDYLGYSLGSRFTYYHKVVDYFNYLASNSEEIIIKNYGQTYEYRDLVLAFVSSKQNLENLDQIRINNQKRAGLSNGQPPDNNVAIVWLSYNVHGNEANSTETAMQVLYDLAANDSAKIRNWLEKLVIIIDPCLNPDGRERYVNWYNQVSGMVPNPNIEAREHHEGWAKGRSNHYLFDLNRDWLWQTQAESVQRLKVYNEWLPQVHVDFHEQGFDDKYYFPPAAQPFHELVSPWQREFQEIVGRNNAKYFDQQGWLYFTRERFDLLYPGYGDTYPMYNGAIGMTYEMAGHSLAGLSIKTGRGDTLKLADRIDMHFTTSLATIETCYENRGKLLTEFERYFQPSGTGAYIMKSSRSDRLRALAFLLEKNHIRYHGVAAKTSVKAYSYTKDQTLNIDVMPGDMIISLNQPKSKLAQILFEKQTKLVDSLTYDITAWSLPYVYGLEAYQTSAKITLSEFEAAKPHPGTSIENPYAYLLDWTSLQDARFLAEILTRGIKVNYFTESFDFNEQHFSCGSLAITRIDNKHIADFHKTISDFAQKQQRNIIPLAGGSDISTIDLGSSKIRFMKNPRIAMLAGDGVSTLDFGQLWYFFEQEINMPIDIIQTDAITRIDLKNYDVLVLASGRYDHLSNEAGMEKLDTWIRNGGKLILLENAIRGFTGEGKFGLKEIKIDEKETDEEEPVMYPYADSERESIKNSIQGGIIKLQIDNTHPLAYGYDKYYYTLKTNTKSYSYLTDGWNVGHIESDDKVVAGFVGSENKAKLTRNLIFGVEERGSGRVVYFVDDPMFRSFWQNGKLFIANALFFDN